MVLTKDMVSDLDRVELDNFRRLQHLACKVKLQDFVLLLPQLRALISFELDLLSLSTATVPTFMCHGLQRVKIQIKNDYTDSFMCGLIILAQRCPQLTHLCVEDSHRHKGHGSEYNDPRDHPLQDNADSLFARLVACLTNLREIRLMIYCYCWRLSIKSLITLGRHCPLLRTCKIAGDFDLALLQSAQQVLFPHLQHLHLWFAAYSGEYRVEASAAMIYYHAPCLQAHYFIFGLWNEFGARDEFGSYGFDIVMALRRLRWNPLRFFVQLAYDNAQLGKARIVSERDSLSHEDQFSEAGYSSDYGNEEESNIDDDWRFNWCGHASDSD